jgi:hypothetical protein
MNMNGTTILTGDTVEYDFPPLDGSNAPNWTEAEKREALAYLVTGTRDPLERAAQAAGQAAYDAVMRSGL